MPHRVVPQNIHSYIYQQNVTAFVDKFNFTPQQRGIRCYIYMALASLTIHKWMNVLIYLER